MKRNSFGGFCVFASGLLMLSFMSCASVRPMDDAAIEQYGLAENYELFKNYQYFVSRDIVLTATDVDVQTDIRGGQAFSDTRIHNDVLQLLASTPGTCLEYKDGLADESPSFKLGIEFDEGSGNLLWFYYSMDVDYFYLDYTDMDNQEIVYAGKTYKVTYEEATGVGAALKRITTSQKAEDGDYQSMEPLLLYEENVKQKETETRRTLGGSKL